MKAIWMFVLLLVWWKFQIEASVRFTNVKCVTLHPEFATFEKCDLKVLGRGLIAVNINVKLWQVPVNNVSFNLALQKKANGYRPFLYNITTDFCKFMANPKRVPFGKLVLDIVISKSNINHTCPYDSNIIVDNLILNEDMFRYLPLPQGEYLFQFKVGAYNDWKADIKYYISVSRDL